MVPWQTAARPHLPPLGAAHLHPHLRPHDPERKDQCGAAKAESVSKRCLQRCVTPESTPARKQKQAQAVAGSCWQLLASHNRGRGGLHVPGPHLHLDEN